jgi:hypothetical protein
VPGRRLAADDCRTGFSEAAAPMGRGGGGVFNSQDVRAHAAIESHTPDSMTTPGPLPTLKTEMAARFDDHPHSCSHHGTPKAAGARRRHDPCIRGT